MLIIQPVESSLVSIILVETVTGYTNGHAVTLTGEGATGSGFTGTAIVTDSNLTGITIITHGINYTAGTVTITAGGVSTATATISVGSNPIGGVKVKHDQAFVFQGLWMDFSAIKTVVGSITAPDNGVNTTLKWARNGGTGISVVAFPWATTDDDGVFVAGGFPFAATDDLIVELSPGTGGAGTVEIPFSYAIATADLIGPITRDTDNFFNYNYRVYDEHSAPIDKVEVTVTTDRAGQNVIGSGFTDETGLVVFSLAYSVAADEEANIAADTKTYYFWPSKQGYNFANLPDSDRNACEAVVEVKHGFVGLVKP